MSVDSKTVLFPQSECFDPPLTCSYFINNSHVIFSQRLDSCHFPPPSCHSFLPSSYYTSRLCWLCSYELCRTFPGAQTIPLQVYTLLCKNTHGLCVWLQTTRAHRLCICIWSRCVHDTPSSLSNYRVSLEGDVTKWCNILNLWIILAVT